MMTNLRYGFDARRPFLNDADLREFSTEAEAWARLDEIRIHLEGQMPLPPELAQWLGEAIKHEGRDPNEFLQRLGLKRRPGERGTYSRRFKEFWQGRLWHLGTYNEEDRKVDAIIAEVKTEMTADGIDEERQPNRETLQDWYTEAMTGSARVR